MTPENYSLKQLIDMEFLNPGAAQFAKRLLVNSYDDFVEVLTKDIEDSIRNIEENPSVKNKDESEDSLTDRITSQLKILGYIATHDAFIGGHVDISVTNKGYTWLGEAKKHSSYDWLEKGYSQLTTRYLRGTSSCNQGGIIIYVFNINCKKIIETWKEKLKKLEYEDFELKDCPLDPEFAFYTTHTHQSGVKLNIRHKAVHLFFQPEDK